jgi:hypothetical protein
VIIGINLLKTGTKKVCSAFLAACMVLPVGFEKANALGTRETVETPDGVVQRIKFTKDEIPAVLDFFRAEKERLEGWPRRWAEFSPVAIGMAYLTPAVAGVVTLFFRLFTDVNDSYWIFSRDANKSGIVFDICLVIMSSLLFVHDGIPRAERISERWDYWNVWQIINDLGETPQSDDYTIEEFCIDETSKGEIKIGLKYRSEPEFAHIPVTGRSGGENFRGLSRNKFWKKF